jgi:prephenate dehydratase
VKLLYLGPPQTFSEQAAETFASELGRGLELAPETSFHAIARGVARAGGTGVLGVLPYYNLLEGLIQESLDLIYEHALTIDAATQVKVAFAVGAASEAAPRAPVRSHPKALAQCSDFLEEKYHGTPLEPVASTAEAARLAAERGEGLAIARRAALERAGLRVLHDDVANRRHGRTNFTEFLLVSAEPLAIDTAAPERRTIVAVTPPGDRVGLLADILRLFAFFELNVAKIHSRPAIDSVEMPIEPQMFYLEVMCPEASPELAACAEALRYRFRKTHPAAEAVRILGGFAPASAHGGPGPAR